MKSNSLNDFIESLNLVSTPETQIYQHFDQEITAAWKEEEPEHRKVLRYEAFTHFYEAMEKLEKNV